jgi:RNA-directed DNA polymerase
MRNPKLPNTLDFNGFYLNALCRRIILRNKSVMVEDVVTQSFDTLSHEWLVKFIEHRIGDRRIVRLIQKWLKAGVLEEGKRVVKEVGTVQGGSISPVLANIYLHLHPEKARLIEFGRFATENRRNRGEGKPETLNFLGFTHICGKTRGGKFTYNPRHFV